MNDQNGSTPPKRPHLRMRFGAEMNEPPGPPPASPPPPEEPANTDAEPEDRS